MGNNFFSGSVPVSAVGLRVFWAEKNKFSHGLSADMANLGILQQLRQKIVTSNKLQKPDAEKNLLLPKGKDSYYL